MTDITARAVTQATVYTRDLEPITVIWLAPWAVQQLNESGNIAFGIESHAPTTFAPDAMPQLERWVVRLRGVKFRLGYAQTWLLVADDDELALMLRAAFLPGQQRAIRELERESFGKGAATAFSIIRRLSGGLDD